MDMPPYLREIKHATTGTISLIWSEHAQLDDLVKRLDSLNTQMRVGYEQARFIAMNDEDPDDVAFAAGVHWDTILGRTKSTMRPDCKAATRCPIGYSQILYECTKWWPTPIRQAENLNGLRVTIFLWNRTSHWQPNSSGHIWQARNQALHWEEGHLRKGVRDCFNIGSLPILLAVSPLRFYNGALGESRVTEGTRFRASS